MADSTRESDKDLLKKELDNAAKLKENSFYRKGIWIALKLRNLRVMCELLPLDVQFLIIWMKFGVGIGWGGGYEIIEFKQTILVKRPDQCSVVVYQLAKLQMLELYYDFLDKYLDRKGFDLCYMDLICFT